MSKVWFTADTHFGHRNIIEYCNRPFSSVEEMDDAMILRWNERVARGDLVYHVGDFAMGDHSKYLSFLHGNKILVRGNHDHEGCYVKCIDGRGWTKVERMHTVKVDGVEIVLCHYALRIWNKAHHGALHFYGHSHGSLPGDSQCCDVGVDCWDFRPASLEEIRVKLTVNPLRRSVDHHVGVNR